jgi:hypothetical protein
MLLIRALLILTGARKEDSDEYRSSWPSYCQFTSVSPKRHKPLVSFIDRSCHCALVVACKGADARSPSTWPGSRPGTSAVESIPRRAELEFSRKLCEAHGLFRPGKVHSVGRKPPAVSLAGIRIPYRVRVFRQLDVWRRSARPQWLCHESGDASFRFPRGQSLSSILRIRV